MLVTLDGEFAGTLEKELTRHDRCDRCGAQAYFQAINESTGLDLLFCAHHGKQHQDALVQSDWVVLDSSHLLTQTL